MDILKVVCLMFFIAHVYGISTRRLLTKSMMGNYEKLTIPEGSPLNVTHTLQLKRLISFDNQVLSLDGYISMQWRDDQLTWNPDDYEGITITRIPSSLLWQPDILLENNAEEFNGVNSDNINMVISFDGAVFFIPPVKIKAYCSADNTITYRYSKVTCTLKFMSWTYDGFSINLEPGPVDTILADFDADFNKDWRVIEASVKKNEQKYACCPEPYIDITYTLVLKGR